MPLTRCRHCHEPIALRKNMLGEDWVHYSQGTAGHRGTNQWWLHCRGTKAEPEVCGKDGCQLPWPHDGEPCAPAQIAP